MYYPKSQIIENKTANPGEFIDPRTGKEYTGAYFETSAGEFYTGKNPQDYPNRQIIPNSNDSLTRNTQDTEIRPESYYVVDDVYYYAKNRDTNLKSPRPPKFSQPHPTEKDYQIGEFQRYFCKKTNENKIIEVNQQEYQLFASKSPNVQWEFYQPLSINWNLVGKKEVISSVNENIVFLLEKRNSYFGFFSYFKGNFSQYQIEDIKKIDEVIQVSREESGGY